MDLEWLQPKNPEWLEFYSHQIQDMLDRGVARQLTTVEIDKWDKSEKPKFYISHLAAPNPNSQTTPIRIVFNSSQLTDGYSLNLAFAKGPDVLVSLHGTLLKFRSGLFAACADITKMFNSIYLVPDEQHMHRWLWSDPDTGKVNEYVMTRVNIGDKPAQAISAITIEKTAELPENSIYPEAITALLESTYVDDVILDDDNKENLLKVATDVDKVLESGGFKTKHWIVSGEGKIPGSMNSGLKVTEVDTKPVIILPNAVTTEKTLGQGWDPIEDVLFPKAHVNFSQKMQKMRLGDHLKKEEIQSSMPVPLTNDLY